jgi:hypothetical protein
MAEFSRRSFFGRIMGTVGALLAAKAAEAKAKTPKPAAPPLTPINYPLGNITTYTYDCRGAFVHVQGCRTTPVIPSMPAMQYPIRTTMTYCYDCTCGLPSIQNCGTTPVFTLPSPARNDNNSGITCEYDLRISTCFNQPDKQPQRPAEKGNMRLLREGAD